MKDKKIEKVCMFLILFYFFGCGHITVSNSQQKIIKREKFQGKIKMGMTRDQVKENWGEPGKIIKRQGKDFDEIWIYVPNWKFKNYLYFKDDVLIKGNPNPEDLV